MKVFQIISNICHWDATRQFPTVADTVGKFPDTDLFVEAPSYVFEGWGFDSNGEGDERFVQPQAPEGWLYDPNTGTFYPEGENPPGDADGPTGLEGEVNRLKIEVAKLEAENLANQMAIVELFETMMEGN